MHYYALLQIGDVLVERANGDDIKIGDFGLAQRLVPGKPLILEYGHPEYVAPEIAKKQEATLAADMWSVGMITYVLLCGMHPYLGANDRETLENLKSGSVPSFTSGFFSEISDEARHFLSNMLVHDPKGRLDVSKALDHPWFRHRYAHGSADRELSCIDNLREYRKSWRNWVSWFLV